jgi:hypothetical protein
VIVGNFYDTPTHPTARKQHRCIACCARIPVGEKHVQQTGFHEGSAFRNRYHQECWDELSADLVFEFTPGDCEPPERLRTGTQEGA